MKLLISTRGKVTNDPEVEGLVHIGCDQPTRLMFMCDKEEAYVTFTFHEQELEANSLSNLPEYFIEKAAQIGFSIDELKRSGDSEGTE